MIKYLITYGFYLFLCLSLTICSHNNFDLSEQETRLIRKLLNESTYLKKVRPTNTVIVDIRIIFNQIVSMVEKEQIIVTNCFVDQKWIDPRLVWNPLEFQNISWIRIPATSVWFPDTFLYNTADNAGFLLPQDSQHMILSYNGTIFWPLPLAQLRTRCRMTIKHFPFDEQICDMIFGSWSHTSKLIHYQFWENKPELPQYTPNNEWKLLAVSQSIRTIDYPNWVEPDTFFEVNFTILIVRKPLQAIYNTVVPALMLTTLTLVSFFIPFAQEMQIGISIMLAYSVFSLRLSEDVPSQSDSVHLISLYLTICMFFSLSAMTWFAIANKLREKRRLPYWIRWLALNYICWFVFASSMHRKAVRSVKQAQLKDCLDTSSTDVTIPLQQAIRSSADGPKTCSIEQDSVLTKVAIKNPSTIQRSIRKEFYSEQLNSLTSNIQCTTPLTNQMSTPKSYSPTIVSFRQQCRNSPISSPKKTKNSPCEQSTKSHLRKILYDSSTKSRESLYAVHIYNRLVFIIFFLIVILINIYTWFFYSKNLQTKLLDNRTPWICFDESRLELVNCTNATLIQ